MPIKQVCQIKKDNPNDHHDVANGGTEEMWLDEGGTPYLYYTGPGNDPNDPSIKRLVATGIVFWN